jgi:hypothetical protein
MPLRHTNGHHAGGQTRQRHHDPDRQSLKESP